jgi:hypothetical protein
LKPQVEQIIRCDKLQPSAVGEMVPNLSQEEKMLIDNMMSLKYSETQLNLIGGILSVICPLSILAISISDAAIHSSPLSLLMLLAYPMTIAAMSVNHYSKSIVTAYLPIVALVPLLLYGLKVTTPVLLCVVGTAAAYHMIFNSLPLVRLKVRNIETSPLFLSASTKLLKYKSEDKNTTRNR